MQLDLKGLATFWEYVYIRQNKVADYKYSSLFAGKK